MNTPQMMQRSSTSPSPMTPSRTESMTPRATAAWAGPNICTACAAPSIVTLLEMIVSGLVGRFGATIADRSALRADQDVDVRDLIALADERLSNLQRWGHDPSFLWLSVCLRNQERG